MTQPTRFLVALLILTLATSLTAQVRFQRTYGGSSYERGWSTAQTADGGYVIAGYTESFGVGGSDVYLVKTDAFGDTVWTRTYGGILGDYGYSVAQTADGGFVITGYSGSFGAGGSDVYLVKTDAYGDTIWARTYGDEGSDYGWSVLQTADSGYVIAGHTSGDVWLLRTDASGDTIWTRTYGGMQMDDGCSVAQTSDGGYVIIGYTESFGAGSADVWLIKTDASGDTLWTRTYGGERSDVGYSVTQTADDGYVIAGYTYSFGAGNRDAWLIKTDAHGDTMWTRTYGGPYWDAGWSVRQTADGGYIVTGTTDPLQPGDSDVWLIKTDASGDTVWTRTYDGTGWDVGWSVAQTADRGYVIAGWTDSFAGATDVWFIKTDSAGRVAIAEPEPPVAYKPAPATIVRGVLHMPDTEMTNAQYPMTLLDVAGRRAMDLRAGPNDIRHISPGIYFIRGKGSRGQGFEGSRVKVVIQH